MTAHHSIAIEIDDWGEPSLTLVCDAPEDADCRSWTCDEEGAEPRPKEPDEGRECWAVEWVSAAGFEDAVTWIGPDSVTRVASIPVDITYSEGVAVCLTEDPEAVNAARRHAFSGLASIGWESLRFDTQAALLAAATAMEREACCATEGCRERYVGERRSNGGRWTRACETHLLQPDGRTSCHDLAR